MPSNQLPEDVRRVLRDKIENLPDAFSGTIIDAIAPLIIEWARKDQAEVDARIVLEDRGYSAQVFWKDRQERADAIRAQFTPETTGGE